LPAKIRLLVRVGRGESLGGRANDIGGLGNASDTR
jgi:hypothetical protein